MYDITKRIEKISSKKDFLTFLNELIIDFRTNRNEWENLTIDLYLEAILSYIEDSEEMDTLDWNHINCVTFAKLLYMGKIYE